MSRLISMLLLSLILFQSAATHAEEKHATGFIPEDPEKYATMPPKRDGVCNPVPNVSAMTELSSYI